MAKEQGERQAAACRQVGYGGVDTDDPGAASEAIEGL